MASRLIGSSRIIFICASRRRKVQRLCPLGTGPQATSSSFASTRPSTLRCALSELILRLSIPVYDIANLGQTIADYDTIVKKNSGESSNNLKFNADLDTIVDEMMEG
ncbi:hypothetical protein ACXO28_08740 [Lactobacillus delbrueckii subsp. bulgaricus]